MKMNVQKYVKNQKKKELISVNDTSRSRIKPHINEAYFRECAEKVAANVNVPVAIVGGIRSKQVIEDILNNTKIEIISLSRPLINDPDFPKKLQAGILKKINVFHVMDVIEANVIDVFLGKNNFIFKLNLFNFLLSIL